RTTRTNRRARGAISPRARSRGNRLPAVDDRPPARAGVDVVPIDPIQSFVMLAFLSPWFLAGAAAAAVPIVLHLLKREPEGRVKLGAVKLLKHAPVEDTERHRLRELLLLALRVATLVLFSLAFARPFFASGAAATRGNALVVALDTSYSMSGGA